MMFLGLDCSTQSLSAILIDFNLSSIVWETSLVFAKEFPQYHTKNGTLQKDGSLVIHSPPLMWIEALDLLFKQLQLSGIDLAKIIAISGSAQQHGSVYLNESFTSTVRNLNPEKTLKENLIGVFSRPTAPIWMDASTTKECEEIREAVGREEIIKKTGSDLFERFTAPQIRKFFKEKKPLYDKTASIALISSFLASVLSGTIAPIDYGDGSGMNLMDLDKKNWDPELLQATAPYLREKLPPLAPSTKVIGPISPYFSKKYGLKENTLSLVWTGDNPSSLIGLGLVEEKMVGISIGTSFTYFGTIENKKTDPAGQGHLFVSPTGNYMPLNCFLNGALAIQKLRDEYGFSWEDFNCALTDTPPGNQGAVMLPYFQAEIIPKVLNPKVHRFHLNKNEKKRNCRALIEAQMLSMKLHSNWMEIQPKTIYATGGLSNNPHILQIIADIYQCPVIKSSVAKSTASGSALTAAYAFFKNKSWQEIIEGFTKSPNLPILPNPSTSTIYEQMLITYAKYELLAQNSL